MRRQTRSCGSLWDDFDPAARIHSGVASVTVGYAAEEEEEEQTGCAAAAVKNTSKKGKKAVTYVCSRDGNTEALKIRFDVESHRGRTVGGVFYPTTMA